MRISEELEQGLKQLEENGADNFISLLSVATAFEKTYEFINNSFISNEKKFNEISDFGVWCRKDGYNEIEGKTLYSAGLINDMNNSTVKVTVSNLGDVSFEIITNNKQDAEETINKLNDPQISLMELVKMNADISFFTENRELVLSKQPYIALKLANFVEGDKAVLVIKEEITGTDKNKKEDGLRYIRVDQISEHLKNINIDERNIPILAYSYLGLNKSEELLVKKNIIQANTFPNLTEEKVNYYKSAEYSDKTTENITGTAIGGSMFGCIAGAAFGSLIFGLPVVGAIALVIIPISIAGGIYLNANKNINRSKEKENLIAKARLETYSLLKEYSNLNIKHYEKFNEIKKRRIGIRNSTLEMFNPSKNNDNSNKEKDVTSTVRNIKKIINDLSDYSKKPFYKLMLTQMLNAYSNLNDKESVETLYMELGNLAVEIDDVIYGSYQELVEQTIETVIRLSDKVNVNATLDILNQLTEEVCNMGAHKMGLLKNSDNQKKITKAYLKVMLNSLYSNEGLSIETLACIPSDTKNNIVKHLRNFGNRLRYSDSVIKKSAGIDLVNICDDSGIDGLQPSEMKVLKGMELIKKSNLAYDLLGQDITNKNDNPKVKKIGEE